MAWRGMAWQVGNAYFALTIHAIPAGWRRLAVVTSDFHMPRTRDLFEAAAGLAGRELWGDAARMQLLLDLIQRGIVACIMHAATACRALQLKTVNNVASEQLAPARPTRPHRQRLRCPLQL